MSQSSDLQDSIGSLCDEAADWFIGYQRQTPAAEIGNALFITLLVEPHLSGPNMTTYGVSSCSLEASSSEVAVRNFR